MQIDTLPNSHCGGEISVYLYTDWRSPMPFWRVSIYILEGVNLHFGGCQFTFGGALQKRGETQKGWYFGLLWRVEAGQRRFAISDVTETRRRLLWAQKLWISLDQLWQTLWAKSQGLRATSKRNLYLSEFLWTSLGADFWAGDPTKHSSMKKKGFSVKRGEGFSERGFG